MKKSVKKMSLSRETLGTLEERKLAMVKGQVGVGFSDGCQLSFNICSNHETCSTCVPETQVPETLVGD
jgi:hypothetical protein